ncbi:hypothetical protein ACFPRL_12755 [Pseudoclavibacter helvolus]
MRTRHPANERRDKQLRGTASRPVDGCGRRHGRPACAVARPGFFDHGHDLGELGLPCNPHRGQRRRCADARPAVPRGDGVPRPGVHRGLRTAHERDRAALRRDRHAPHGHRQLRREGPARVRHPRLSRAPARLSAVTSQRSLGVPR